MIITLTILSIFFSFVSGFSKAICDLSEEGKLKWKPKTYWIKSISSINKYQFKNKVIRYLMKTIFVAFTDAFHLFEFLFRITFATSFITATLLLTKSNWFAFSYLVVYLIFAGTFHIFFTYLFTRQPKEHRNPTA